MIIHGHIINFSQKNKCLVYTLIIDNIALITDAAANDAYGCQLFFIDPSL